MIVRKLRPNEFYKAAVINSVAFEMGNDFEKEKAQQEAMTPEETAEKEKVTPPENPLPSEYFKRDIWAALSDDEKTVYGCMSVYPYTVRFDGSLCVMGGIGGVATLPPYRRKGVIRECMRAALADMDAKGYDFSYLYPFSRAYYRKFGFENSYEYREWEVSFDALRDYGSKGSVRMLAKGDDFSVLTELYNRRYADYNLSSVRREYDPDITEKNFLADREYAYVWYNEAGEPRGFMIFRNRDGVMVCTPGFGGKSAFLALDAEAYMGLFDFARMFAPRCHAIRFCESADINLHAIFGEGNAVSCRLYTPGMSRVISVRRVLEKCRCRGEGELNIHIEDPTAPWNDGTWKLRYGAKNTVESTADPADISMTVNAFSAMISGHIGFADLPFVPGAKVLNEAAPLGDVFYKKKSVVLDLF